MQDTQVVLDEKLVLEGAQAWLAGAQQWRAFQAVLNNHAQHGRLSAEDQELYVDAVVVEVRARQRRWALDAPDIN